MQNRQNNRYATSKRTAAKETRTSCSEILVKPLRGIVTVSFYRPRNILGRGREQRLPTPIVPLFKRQWQVHGRRNF